MSTVVGLKCRECGKRAASTAVAACPECWGGLEPEYDLDRARRTFKRALIASRPRNLWRYAELLPVDPDDVLGASAGFTPLLPAPRLGARLGIGDLWIKYEAANQPTLSFKDRLVAVALVKAREFAMETVGCSSTGNLAQSLAAGAAAAGQRALVVVPEGLGSTALATLTAYGATVVGVRGNYDRANRLCVEIADRHGWGIVNVNLRAYYGEGSKTVGFEIAEQRAWSLPGHVVVPMAGGSLLTKIGESFQQLTALGLVDDTPVRLHGAQAAGCAPIVAARKAGTPVRPVKPTTIVHSLAVGDPADGPAALEAMRRSEGRAEDPSDDESLEGVRLLARTEGLFAETAGGTVVAAARRLAAGGAFSDGRSVVLVITGQGLKTVETLTSASPFDAVIDGGLAEFDAFWSSRGPGQDSFGTRAR